MRRPRTHRTAGALLLDGAGTLLHVREPVAETYARIGCAHDVQADPAAIASRFAEAMSGAWAGCRYVGDARPYWREVIRHATGSDDPGYHAALYEHYARAHAWTLAPGAERVVRSLRARGMRVAVVSNWDLRLRPLLAELGVLDWIDAAVISAEVGMEKPDPRIFQLACERLGVDPAAAVHVGDDEIADVGGASAAGCRAWRWGSDVRSFEDIARKLA